jgi:L-2-hydroxyglutarate oxidase LhgO
MDEVAITIIGAGVVGLAIAAELSKTYDGIVMLERHEKFGQETSSRNSEVVHSGIYYPKGSLKARLCVEGADMLYEYCENHSVPFDKPGKLIVAVDETEVPELLRCFNHGIENGVGGLRIIEKDEIASMEPLVNGHIAIYSQGTGIIDSHSLMKQLFNIAESQGVLFSFGSCVNFIERRGEGYVIGVENDEYKFFSRQVINSAGLFSDRIAGFAGIDIDSAGYRLRYCKGSYFSYAKASPVKRLVYPIPHQDLTGLGVHATLDLGGRLRFGPDTEYVESLDYTVDAKKKDVFYKGASKIIRGLEKDAFYPDMSGVRPKIKGEGIKDFVIRHEFDRGLPGFINLIGIESPGLTSCLSIARYVEDLISEICSQ